MSASEQRPLPQEALVLPSTFMQVSSRGLYTIPDHISFIEDKVIDAIVTGDQLLTIEAPVRHGKSFYVDWHLPAWYLASFPDRNVGLASYEHRFAAGWGQRARDTLIEHGPSAGVRVHSENRARAWWEIEHHGGSMRSMGVGGAITGQGFNLFIVDDPIKNAAQANSSVIRDAQWEWLQSTVLTRLEPGAVCILMMARWHQDDLIGRVHQEMPREWTRIRLPAIAEANDPMGRPVGAALWPERYPVENLMRRKARVGTYWFNALYDQRPSPAAGSIFKREWFNAHRYGALPAAFDRGAWSWDMSFKDGKDSSYVVGQCWGVVGEEYYLAHQVRARMDFPTAKQALRDARDDPRFPWARDLILVEDKANGPAIISELRHEVAGLVAVPTGSDSKVGRASAISGVAESGNVHLPDTAVATFPVGDFIEEAAAFPNGAHDDQVDTFSQAIRELRERTGGGVVFRPQGDLPTRRV